MARSTKTTPAKPTAVATAPVRAKRRSASSDPAPTATPRAKTKVGRSVAAQAASKVTAARGKQAAAAVPAAAPTRVPPPSKGELRVQIDKLETANAALKAKSREANRAAKAAARRIAELEEQVAQLQAEAAQPTAPPAPPAAEAKTSGAAGHPDVARPSTRVTQCRPVLPCRILSRWTRKRARPGMRWRRTFQGGSDAASARLPACLPTPKSEQCRWLLPS